MKTAIAIGFVLVVALAGRADAYPQFQISRDRTCTSCHLSPDGGGLLTENGTTTAELMSQYGTDPEFMYSAWTPPSWLKLGGDFRGMAGYLQAPQRYLYAFPMQGDVYAAAVMDNVSVHATVGIRPAQDMNRAATTVWAREHFVQYQSEPNATEGLWARLGHFMPVFGLRFVEHPVYTRRYGGTPLYSETYGASLSYVTDTYEAHASAFIKNPVMDGVQQSNGGALYGELRLGEHTQVGGGAMITANDWEQSYRGTVTAKRYVPEPGILVQAELQVVNPQVESARGDYGFTQIVGYLMGSYFVTDAILVDVGLGHYDENVRIRALDRNNIDVNVHWFATSHLELMLVTRSEMIGKGDGGPAGAWAFLQAHYRL